jgi:hypothetical protein
MTDVVRTELVNTGRTGIFRYGSVILDQGSRDSELTVSVVDNIGITSPQPVQIFLQTQQRDDNERNYPDAFALQVVVANDQELRFRVRRVDASPPHGWGQGLQIHVLMTDAGPPPFSNLSPEDRELRR